MSGLLAGLLPSGAACAEAFDDTRPVDLFPAEREAVARAVDKRRREYATVRRCAREALATLGYPPVPLLTGERGAPVWPAGVVGSMTHCAGYRAAVVAPTGLLWTTGIDAEPAQPLPEGVLESIALPGELAELDRLAHADPQVPWDRLLFSAKESVYKSWFPLTRKWLDFEQASITIDPVARTFRARLLLAAAPGGRPLTGFDGRFVIARGLVITAIAVPA